MKSINLPTVIKWLHPHEVSSSSYQEVLVAMHKHSVRDWTIYHGWIQPIDNYTDHKVFIKLNGMSKERPDVEVQNEDILAIGLFVHYGAVK